jgi:hypothetical protein
LIRFVYLRISKYRTLKENLSTFWLVRITIVTVVLTKV